MAKIFINYRTGDEQGTAVLMKRELSDRFGGDAVFLASTMIPPGHDFERELLRRVRGCEVLLAVVGPRWLTASHPSGGRAIDDPIDWVRREISEAFASAVRVIPILVNDTERLTNAGLPDDIAPLARCQYLRLRHRDFEHDLARIAAELSEQVPSLRHADSGPPADQRSITMKAQASGHGRVYQAGRDQVINE